MACKPKIALISRWNATCGIALHAEMIGRELLRRGYNIRIFAPTLESAGKWWHHLQIREDEEFVERVYEEIDPEGRGGYFDLEKVKGFNPDIIIIESYQSLPHSYIEKLITDLNVPSIVVPHEGDFLRYGDLSIFTKFAVFDERFKRELIGDKLPEERVEIIPYPCYPLREQKRRFAEDGKIVFVTFGRQPAFELEPYINALRHLRNEYKNIVYRIIRANEPVDIKEDWIIQEVRILDLGDIDGILSEADIHLLPKAPTKNVVVSSTLYQIMGILCITVVPDTRHFEMHRNDGTVVMYESEEDLVEKLKDLIGNEEERMRIKENMRRFVEKNSVEKIVDRFEKLINSVLVKDIKEVL